MQDLHSWRQCDSIMDTMSRMGINPDSMDRAMTSPWQYSIHGVLIRNTPRNSHGLFKENERLLSSLRNTINALKDTFYNDPIAVGCRIGYSPIRMLGWWRKNLKDELDWLGTGGMPMPVNRITDQNTITEPPSGYVDNTECIHQVIQTANALHYGVPSNHISPASIMGSINGAGITKTMDSLLIGDGSFSTTIGIDFEMTGLDPIGDWVLNVGWAKSTPGKNNITPLKSVMFGVPESRMSLGNPASSINGITTQDVKGLPALESDTETQGEIMDALYSHPVMTAHSANMEDALLEQCVDGYAEAKRDGIINIVDTRLLSMWLDRNPDKTSNRLEDYARRWRVLGADEHEAHHGLDDTMLMLQAEDRQLSELSNSK